jgi:hypothetical protein
MTSVDIAVSPRMARPMDATISSGAVPFTR